MAGSRSGGREGAGAGVTAGRAWAGLMELEPFGRRVGALARSVAWAVVSSVKKEDVCCCLVGVLLAGAWSM